MSTKFYSIGESIHASIPKHAAAMKALAEMGPEGFQKDSKHLDHVLNLIKSQAADGADYIAINVDDLGENDMKIAVDNMVEYVKLVRKHSNGVPVCIDSSDDDVLKAGLKEWYNTDEKVTQPLVNSIKVYTIDNMMPLKKDYDFSFVGLLMAEEQSATHSADDLYALARKIFDAAMQHGFKPEEIFFDTTVFPLAIDMPMQPGQPGYTYCTFQTFKMIKEDPDMANCHCSMGVSNSARDLPTRKIGIMRAYVHVAMTYGADAGIVNPKHKLYAGDPDQDLIALVETYAKMDGSSERMTDAMMAMGQFCQNAKK